MINTFILSIKYNHILNVTEDKQINAFLKASVLKLIQSPLMVYVLIYPTNPAQGVESK